MNWTLTLLSHTLVFLFCLIPLGQESSQKLGLLSKSCGPFSAHFMSIYISQFSFSLRKWSRIQIGALNQFSVVLTKSNLKPFVLLTISTSPNFSNLFLILFSCRSFKHTCMEIPLRKAGMLYWTSYVISETSEA